MSFISAIGFWLAKAAAEVALFFVVAAIALVIGLIAYLPTWFKQVFCTHERYWETRSCDAVCSRCNKNLGFIGKVRDRRKT